MANRKKQTAVKTKAALIASSILIFTALLVTFGEKLHISFIPTWNDIYSAVGLQARADDEYSISVTFLDVGQGDCIIVRSGDFSALIDGGEKENSDKIIDYLSSHNIDKLDYVFATHPHSDHIGALPDVLSAVKTDNVIMPHIPDNIVPTTCTYEDFLNAVSQSGAKTAYSKVGDSYKAGGGLLTALGPVGEGNDLNNCSLVLRFDYKDTSFLFMGDSEKPSENKILNDEYEKLDADVIKLGHHGSSTSSGKKFMGAVSPQYAVVCCGEGNKYGHPDSETLALMEEKHITCLRTDMSGTITFQTDGVSCAFISEKGNDNK